MIYDRRSQPYCCFTHAIITLVLSSLASFLLTISGRKMFKLSYSSRNIYLVNKFRTNSVLKYLLLDNKNYIVLVETIILWNIETTHNLIFCTNIHSLYYKKSIRIDLETLKYLENLSLFFSRAIGLILELNIYKTIMILIAYQK